METVRRLMAMNASLCVVDRDEAGLSKVNEMYKDQSSRLLCLTCDITQENQVKKAMEEAVKRFGTIHVAIACAGITALTPTLTSRGPLNTKAFRSVLTVNLMGSMFVSKYAALYMSKNKAMNEQGEKGVIILTSSTQASEGQRAQLAYSASKGAIDGMVLPMARDLGKYGIRTVAIAPSLIATGMTKDSMAAGQLLKKNLREYPLGRLGT